MSREAERRLHPDLDAGSLDARHRLVRSNLGFVVQIALQYRNLGLPLEDLLSEGNVGLMEAARRFDTSRGTRFLTYAAWWIRRAIRKALGEKSRLVRLPYEQVKKAGELRAAEDALLSRLRRPPERHEIARHLERRTRDVEQLQQLDNRPASLDQPVGEEQRTPLSELIPDGGVSPESRLIEQDVLRRAARAFRLLRSRQREVLVRRLGLHGRTPETLEEVGRRIRVSRERVRQIEIEAKRKLRRLVLGAQA